MTISVNRVPNAAVYIGGTSFLGRAEKVELPSIKQKMEAHTGLGLVGAADLPVGLDKLEGSIAWNSFYTDALLAVSNVTAIQQIQVRASVDIFTSAGRTEQQPLLCTLSVLFHELPMGSFEHQKPSAIQSKFAAYAAKTEIGGVVIMDYDFFANRYFAAGADILARYREIVG